MNLDHRHRCEVRHLIALARKEGRQAVVDYLSHKSVAPRAARLKAELNEQRNLGNTGAWGQWIERRANDGSSSFTRTR